MQVVEGGLAVAAKCFLVAVHDGALSEKKKQFSLSVIKFLSLPGFNIYKSRQCKTQNQHYLLNRSQNQDRYYKSI